ncbi:filamentous hemagglutinin N-terminal domain-containing protein [Sphingomonas sp. PAMC26645]|uniref:two-partner secretion domain-containing protein n=1 Tax=Sphingomonas sp. PAMC26645 TaxID=2565555 RepID=UPI001445B12F|nr:filamentous hemagglutinin N-terminal domain-containing protein [Sphingomonas sp. PAMC26645]
MTHVTSPVRRRRLLLIVTSALGGIAALPAVAQTVPAPPVLPTRASVDSVQTNVLGSDPRITSPNGNLNVELRANNTVINWKGFNIPKDQAANFENGTASSNIAVLNRDISSNPSQLLGKLTSSAGVAVWVLNSNGIVVGPGANFTTGSLVLSTLDVTDTDFLDGGSNYRLSSGMNGAGSMSAITVASGAQMTVEGGNRGLIMIAPRIEADGVFQAKGQDVAFVTATDVTLNYATNSPLSVTLNRGTAVPKNSQYVRGTVDGRDALFALASQGNITDALLQIDARVTTASNGRRGIVLSAGKPDTAVAGITVAGAAADTGGIAGVSVSGVLSTQSDDNGDIIAGASGTASFARALTSGRDVILSAGGALTVAGDVTATRDYRIAAQGIALGSGTSAIQRSGRGVDLVSTNGNITGAAGLSLRSGGSAGLTLSTVGTAAGDILFDATSSISGGSDRSGYVDIRQRGPANQIALGNVAARGLRQAIGAGAIRNGLTTTSSLALGNIDVRDGLALDAAGISAGTLASDRGVAIVSNGALTTSAITAGSGPVALTGGGTTSVAGTITAIGSTVADITIVRDGAMTLQGLTATRDAQIDAVTGAVSIAGAVGLGRNYRVSGSGVTLGAPGAVTQRADGAITITAGAAGITGLEGLALRSDANGSGNDPLTLAVTAPSTTGIAFAPGTSLFGGTSRQSDVQLQLNDAASPISLGQVEARSLTGLSTTGALRSGDVNIVRDLTASGASIATGALTASSGAVTLTATGGALTIGAVDAGQGITLTGTDAIATGRLTARDAVTVNAVGAATFGSDVTAGGALTLRGASLGFAGGNVWSGGSIDLLASSGGIVATGGVALASTSTRTSDFVRLQAAGVDGIVLASGSSITAGANRALRIGIFNAAADAPLSLGNVTARSLSALGAANADATVLGGAIVSGGSLTFGALDLVDGFAAKSAGGNLSVGRLAVTGAGQGISLRAANGTLTVQNDVSASGDVTLVSGTALQLGTVESRDGQATLTSGGTVTLGTLAGRLGASASGTQIAIDTVRGGAVGLTASSGNVQVGRIDGAAVTATATGGAVTIRNALAATGAVNLTATGDVRVGGAITGAGVTVGAQGDTALLGGLQARGNVALSGRSVTLGGAQGAMGSYTATSSAGAITGNAGTAIVADSDNLGGEALSLTATGGGIIFDPATSLRGGNGTSAVSLATDGGIITVGDVGATVFTANGAGSIRTGSLTLTKSLALSAAGGVTTGAVATGDGTVTIDSVGGAVTTGAIDAGGGVSLAGDTVTFGTVRAASLNATAKVGTLTGGDITVDGVTALQTPGALAVGAIRAGNSVSLSGSTVRFGRVEASAFKAAAGAALNGGDIVTRGDATLTAGDALAVGVVDADGIVALRGTTVNAGRIDGASLTAVASKGALVAGDMLIGGSATIEATEGPINLGTVDSRGDLTITAGGRLFATGLVSGGTASLKTTGPGSDILLANGLVAENGVDVRAMGNVRAPVIRSRTGDLTIAAPNGELSGYDANSGVTLGAGPGKAFSLTIGTAARLGDVVGGKLTVVATSISAGRVDTGNDALELRATNGDLTLTGPASGGTVTLDASGRTQLAGVTSKGALALTGGSIAFSDISGATIDATSAGAITGGSATATGSLAIRGSAVTLNQASAGTTLRLTATDGDLTLAGPVTGGDVKLGASGAANLAKTTAIGALTLSGGSIAFSDVSGATVDATSAGAITGGSATAKGALDISGGAVTLNQANAGTTLGLRATDGDLTLTGPVTGGDVTLGARGRTSLTKTTARGALKLTGGGIAFSDISGGSIDATSAGGITGGSATATGALAIRGGTVNLGQANGGTTLGLTATNGDLTLTGPATGGTVTIGASGQTALTDVTAKGAMTLTGGTIAFANIAGASVGVTSPGAITGTSATATGALGVRGGTVTLDRAGAGAALALTATNGDLAVTGPVTGGDVTLGASGRTRLGKATATGALVLTGGSVGFADIAGASIDATSTGAITGTSAATTGTLGVRGATVALGQIAAGGTATVAATGGDLALTGLTSGSDAILSATGVARISGAVTSGGAYRVTGGSVTLGDTGIVQKAAGEVSITATSGDLTGVRGLTLTSDSDGTGADRLVLDSAGQIAFAGTRIQARPGGGAVLGLRAGAGRAMQFGSIEASRIGSFDGNAIVATLSHNANIGADDIAVSDLSVALARGDLTFGKVGASGNLTLRTDAGAIALGEVRGGDIELASNGALTTANVTSTGGTSLKGETIDVRGRLSAARQLLADARAALTLRDVGAGGSATLKAGGAIVADTVEAASITASGAGVTLANAKAGDALALTSGRDLSLGSGSAGGSATLDVAGLATIGALAAGPAVTVTANDVALNGPVRSQTVAFANRAPATTTMRIGDGTGADGFRLSDAEVRQVTADTLRFDAGAGAMEVGTLALGTGSGRAVEMLGTGDIRVIGAVSTQGSGRSVRIGGGLTEGNANAIHVVATRDGGGRLLFDGSDVELRGTRIAIGLAPGFVDTLQPGAAGIAQAQSLIGNGNSALYNPQLGGGFYDPASTTTLSARSLTVRFGDYALFQNTAIPGEFSGLKLGGTQSAPVSPALRISTFGTPGQASVALFGTINGIDGASAALLGNPIINIDPVLLASSRINGCLAGSGAGCITTIVIQPTLQVFDWSSEEVFGISRDVTVPFAPLIGSNNEELLTDLPALAPQSLTDQKAKP